MRKTIFKITKIFAFPITILLLHLVLALTLDIYSFYPEFDIPMHLLGGLAISVTYFKLLKLFQKNNYLGKMNKLIFFLFVISLVALTAVLWEFTEFALDTVTQANTQLGLTDTILDLFLGLIGGMAGYFIVQGSKKI